MHNAPRARAQLLRVLLGRAANADDASRPRQCSCNYYEFFNSSKASGEMCQMCPPGRHRDQHNHFHPCARCEPGKWRDNSAATGAHCTRQKYRYTPRAAATTSIQVRDGQNSCRPENRCGECETADTEDGSCSDDTHCVNGLKCFKQWWDPKKRNTVRPNAQWCRDTAKKAPSRAIGPSQTRLGLCKLPLLMP